MSRKLALGAALFLAFLDQATKLASEHYLEPLPHYRQVRLIEGLLYLKHTTNSGGIGGAFEDLPVAVFLVVSAVFIGYVILLILRLDRSDARYLPTLSLLLGGFVGNAIDRVRNGYVTDFVLLNNTPHWLPASFNVADLAILFGLVWLVGAYLLCLGRRPPKEESS